MFAFHQFNFAGDLHITLISQLRLRNLLIYRFRFSHIKHLVLSLVYSLMTLAFQVPVNLGYGRAGFMVLWVIL